MAVTETALEVVAEISLGRLLGATDDVGRVAGEILTTHLPEARVAAEEREGGGGSKSLIPVALALEAVGEGVLGGGDVSRALKELHRQTALDVPRDVAVHEPGAWVVGHEADNGVALRGQHGGVTTRWAVKVERADQAGREGTGTLAEDGEVMAVQMHWVRDEELVLDDEVDPLVGTLSDDSDVLGSREGGVGGDVSCLGELLEGWETWVDVHGVAVQVPAEDGAIVGGGNSAELTSWESGSLSGESTGGTSGLGDNGNQRCKRLILADTCNIAWTEAGG